MNFDRTPLLPASSHQERVERAQALLQHIHKSYRAVQKLEGQLLLLALVFSLKEILR
jgi:hypothetical protein